MKDKIGDAVLMLVPLPTSPRRDWLGLCALIATVATAIFTAVIAWANWDSAKAGLHVATQTAEDRDTEKREAWKRAKVFEIIELASNEKGRWGGLTFEEIMQRYRIAAQQPEEKVRLGEGELQPFALRKLLLALQESNLIYLTVENKYVSQRSSISSKEELLRSQTLTSLAIAILKIVRRKSGEYTESELEREVKEKAAGTTDDDFIVAMHQLAPEQAFPPRP